MSFDLKKTVDLLAELHEVEERIIDRGPVKVLPRPDAPDIPKLQARMAVLFGKLHVRRNYDQPKGHDLAANGEAASYDLASVGVVELVKTVAEGKDRALPQSTTIVRVGFPSGEHLWFDPNDLESVEPPEPPEAGNEQ